MNNETSLAGKKMMQRIIVTVSNPSENEQSAKKRSKVKLITDDDFRTNTNESCEETRIRKIPIKSNLLDSSNTVSKSTNLKKKTESECSIEFASSIQKPVIQKRKRIVYNNDKADGEESFLTEESKGAILNNDLDDIQREILVAQLKQKRHPDNLSEFVTLNFFS